MGAAQLPLVPVPLEAVRTAGEPFVLRPGVRVVAGPDPEAVSVGVLIAHRIGARGGFPVALADTDDGPGGALVLTLTDDRTRLGLPDDVPDDLATEAYRAEVTAERVTITALTAAGLLNGAYTVQQLVERAGPNAPATITAAVVTDHPRFAWRGLSLDVARHFFTVADVRQVLDVMASLRLNVLHLHLTDDQGWRLEIPSRPELTEVSGQTAVGGDPGGCYSSADWAEIVTYASARHVVVVPEIDLPGHVNAALHAVGALNPDGRPAPAYTGVDVGFSRLHADLPATRDFLRDVLGTVASLAPGGWVHIGGDEVLTMSPDEYRTLIRAAADELASAGASAMGWQEAAVAAPAVPLLQYWDERTGAEAVAAAVAQGARVVLSPASRTYLDMRYDADTPYGQDWAGHIELRDAYEWEPAAVLPQVPLDRVAGVEAAVWTENIRTREELFTMLLPRLAAVAEVAWSVPERRSWESFAARLPAVARRWDDAGVAWYPSPQVRW